MKVSVQTKKTTQFCELPAGEVFLWENHIFVKCSGRINEYNCNAVELGGTHHRDFVPSDEVVIVKEVSVKV